jgi:hypothetical protein
VEELGVVAFHQNAWDKGAPDAAGCITYTANRDDADLNYGERLLRAPRNATVVFCNGALHLAANIAMVAQFRAVAPGFLVVRYRSLTFQADRWTRGGPTNKFLMTYTANAAMASVVIVTARGLELTLLAPRVNATIQTVDRFAHLDSGFAPRQMTDAGRDCLFDPPLPAELLVAAIFLFLETGECYQPVAED